MHIALEFDISEAEAIAALKFNHARLLRKARRPWVSGVYFVLSLTVWGAFGYFAANALFAVDASTAQVIVGLFVLAALLMSASQLQVHAALFGYLAGRDGPLRGARTLRVDDAGVRVVGAHAESYFPWPGFRSVEEFAGQTLLYVDQASFVQIPHRAFADEAERVLCLDWVAARIAQEGVVEFSPPVQATPAARAAELPVVRPLKDQLVTLWLGVRAALFLNPDTKVLHASWSQLAALLALGLSLPLAADMINVGWNGSFSPYGLPGALFPLPILMLAAWALARLADKVDRTLDLLVVFVSLSLPIDLVTVIVGQLMETGLLPNVSGQLRYFAYYAPTLWLVLAATLVAVRQLDLPAPRWLAAGLAASVLLGAPLSLVYRERTLWQPAFDPDAQAEQRNRYHALTSEDSFYLQPKLLERQLHALQPGRKGHVDLYFVGAAGDAGQDVFMKEVQSVAGLFEERFDTAGRSLALINNARTVAGSPIASNTSLRLAFKRVGEVMDKDEDILFLFLTSHGSQDHRFSLSFSPLQFNPLDPRRLREMLDDADIKRRVIVVSSCYSGGYVEALENENTLVITAAAADKASFGCSNEAEFTYFGKAYFDEALRQTHSFVEAFELAKPRIAEREREQDYEPSGARMSVGAAIRPVLANLAAARSATPVPASAPAAVPSDAFDEYTELAGLTELIEQSRSDCRREMELYAPARVLADEPGAFGGIKPGVPHWPRLVVLWERYAEDWCASSNDVGLYRKLYGETWRERFKERDIDAALRFFRTPPGHRFLFAQNDVARVVSGRLLEARAAQGNRLQRRFQAEQAAVMADYQREMERVRAAKASPP